LNPTTFQTFVHFRVAVELWETLYFSTLEFFRLHTCIGFGLVFRWLFWGGIFLQAFPSVTAMTPNVVTEYIGSGHKLQSSIRTFRMSTLPERR